MTQFDYNNPSWLNIPDEDNVPESMQGLFAKAKEVMGFVPNVFVGYTIRPTHFKYWFAHYKEIMMGESELSRADREMICLVVSAENDCLYCLVAHGSDLRTVTEDPVMSDRITYDYTRAGLDEKTIAMLDYAVKLTRHPHACNEADLNKLREAGFSDQAIFDIIEVASMFNFTNRLASATGMMPNVEYHSIGR